MTANGPIALERATQICSMGFVTDPELAEPLATPNGSVEFLQVVGLTVEEERAAKQWRTRNLLEVLLPHMPLWVTDLGRASLLAHPAAKQQVEEGLRRDGSASGFLFTDVLGLKQVKATLNKSFARRAPRFARSAALQMLAIARLWLRFAPSSPSQTRARDFTKIYSVLPWRLLRKPITQVTVGARQVDELVTLLPLRLPFGRTLRVAGHEWQLLLEPAAGDGGSNAVEWQGEGENAVVLRLTNATVQQLAQTLQPRQGSYVLPLLPQVEWVVEKTTIKDSTGKVVEVIG